MNFVTQRQAAAIGRKSSDIRSSGLEAAIIPRGVIGA
jgi:hypothetical protein